MNELYHHGILGMKWGVRRYQNEDGTLTAEGRMRYGDHVEQVEENQLRSQMKSAVRRYGSKAAEYEQKEIARAQKEIEKTEIGKEYKRVSEYLENVRKQIEKKYGNGSPTLSLSNADAKYIQKVFSEYGKAVKDYMYKNGTMEKYTSMLLQEMGYRDTAVGREYVQWILRK